MHLYILLPNGIYIYTSIAEFETHVKKINIILSYFLCKYICNCMSILMYDITRIMSCIWEI